MREKSPEEFPCAVFSLFPFLNLFVPGEFGDEIRHNRAGIRKASFTIRLLAQLDRLFWAFPAFFVILVGFI